MGTRGISISLPAEKHARNAVYSAVAVFAFAFLNAVILLASVLGGPGLNPLNLIETLTLLGLMYASLYGARQILRGDAEGGAWTVIYAFAVSAFLRTILRDSIGIPLGVMAAVVASIVGYLTLPAHKAGRASILGYGSGAAIVIFDLFAAVLYVRQPSGPDIVAATGTLAGFVFLLQLGILLLQGRRLGLGVKVASAFSIFTLTTVIAVGFSGIQIMKYWMAVSADATGLAGQTVTVLQQGIIVTGALVSFLGTVMGAFITGALAAPLQRLAETSTKVASGNLDARAALDTEDEVGELASSFNKMADALKGMIRQLEARAEERTRALERRAGLIRTAAEIGRASTSVHDLESLLEHTTRLISERFGFYHIGIFLLDPANEYAVLRSANSEGGKKMLERGHRLKVGETGIVGYVTRVGKPRVALDVGKDAVFFDNPDLPDTRSEMALPLMIGDQILGALDVQSVEEQAFTDEDIETLQIVADQLAIAIQNARLFSETQEALELSRRAYGKSSREAWRKTIKNEPRTGYISSAAGTTRISSEPPSVEVIKAMSTGDVVISSDGLTISVPINIRGLTIGALRLKKSDLSKPWTPDETSLAIALTEQISGALESARLYKEAQQLAARERIIGEISSRIGAVSDMESILQTAVEELGSKIGSATEVTIELASEER